MTEQVRLTWLSRERRCGAADQHTTKFSYDASCGNFHLSVCLPVCLVCLSVVSYGNVWRWCKPARGCELEHSDCCRHSCGELDSCGRVVVECFRHWAVAGVEDRCPKPRVHRDPAQADVTTESQRARAFMPQADQQLESFETEQRVCACLRVCSQCAVEAHQPCARERCSAGTRRRAFNPR